MTETGWQAIGRIAKARRERLGLRQDELAEYGGPKVATVGKFERGAQESFPLRTQHQLEKALGWSRTTIEQVVASISSGDLTPEDWSQDLIENHIPDMDREVGRGDEPLENAVDVLRSTLRLVPARRRLDAMSAATRAILPFVGVAKVDIEYQDMSDDYELAADNAEAGSGDLDDERGDETP